MEEKKGGGYDGYRKTVGRENLHTSGAGVHWQKSQKKIEKTGLDKKKC